MDAKTALDALEAHFTLMNRRNAINDMVLEKLADKGYVFESIGKAGEKARRNGDVAALLDQARADADFYFEAFMGYLRSVADDDGLPF